MTQWLDVLAALAEDPSLIPRTHTGQLTILPLAPTPKDLTPTSGLWRHCTHMHTHTKAHESTHHLKVLSLTQ